MLDIIVPLHFGIVILTIGFRCQCVFLFLTKKTTPTRCPTLACGMQLTTQSGTLCLAVAPIAAPTTSFGGVTQRAKLVAADGAMNDRFGLAVAISGNVMVVGAPYDGDKGLWSGSAYVYTRDVPGSATSGWTQRAKLVAADGAADDNFGYAVAISGDSIVVGAWRDDDKGSNSGSAYVYNTTEVLASTVVSLTTTGGQDALIWKVSLHLMF